MENMEVSNGNWRGPGTCLTCTVLMASLMHKHCSKPFRNNVVYVPISLFFPFVRSISSQANHTGKCDHSAFLRMYK